jgi:hypothetical protein
MNNGNDLPRELLTIEEYLALSAKINYQLSARCLNKPALLALLLGPAQFDERDRAILVETFDALQAGYQGDRRRLGTPGILHPLRAAAILARTMPRPTLLHMLAALLHDKEEDLTEDELGSERWGLMQEQYKKVLDQLDAQERSAVSERVTLLSHLEGDSYQEYLGRLLDHARTMPELLHIKLSDRLDNTFDIHLQHPGVTNYNFYRAVFDILFMPDFRGVEMGSFHFMPDEQEGVMLLSQLFKNLSFLALLRHDGLDRLDDTTERLFVGLAVAGIREAQWLALEMFNTCITDVQQQRCLLMGVMQYCIDGGVRAVTLKEAGNPLDGILIESFAAREQGQDKEMFCRLFQDHNRLARMVLAFIVMFASFINDPQYTVHGIERSGVGPVRG